MLTHASLCSTRHGASSDYSFGTHGWCGGTGLLALAGGRSVCLYDVAHGRVVSLLGGHGVSVRAVRWLHQPTAHGYGDETELASCGGDGLIKVWRITHQVLPSQCGVPWVQCGELAGHSGGVATLATLHLGGVVGGGGHVLASAGIDSTLRLWHRPAGRAWEERGEDGRSPVVQASTTLRCPAESVALSRLPDYLPAPHQGGVGVDCDPLQGILLAAGGTDCRVHLYTASSTSGAAPGEPPCAFLTPLASLQGHGNWIRSLAFSAQVSLREHFPHQWKQQQQRVNGGRVKGEKEEEEEEEGLLLASAAQDGKCRLWRVKYGGTISSSSSSSGVMGVGGLEGAAPLTISSSRGRVRGEEEEEEEEEEVEDDLGKKVNEEGQLLSGGSLAMEGEEGQQQQYLLGEGTRLCIGDRVWYVTSDALLTGHTGWVTHASWAPPQLRQLPTAAAAAGQQQQQQQQWYQPPVLLSSSMDKSVLIWSPAPREATHSKDSNSGSSSRHGGVWSPVAKLTPTGEDTGSGRDGSSLGLTGVYASPAPSTSAADATTAAGAVVMNVCVTNIHGALCAWSGVEVFGRSGEGKGRVRVGDAGQQQSPSHSPSHTPPHYLHLPSLTGHRAPITSLAWSPCATYLLSTSTDTTCRVWRQHSSSNSSNTESSPPTTFLSRLWVEVSRPMLHGWEVRCVGSCTLRGGLGHAAIVGSAEKVLRVMAAPLHFLEALGDGDPAASATAVEYAYVPELGLSAKGVPRLLGGGGLGGGPSGAATQQQQAALKGPHFSDAHQLDGKDAMPLPLHKSSPKPAAVTLAAAGDGSGGSTAAATSPLPAPLFSLVTGPGAPEGRPSETSLVAHGRWQEVDKLYGHVGEVSCMAVWWSSRSSSSSIRRLGGSGSGSGNGSTYSSKSGGRGEGRYAVSGGVGKNEGDCALLLWDIWEGSLLGRGKGHRLTVSAVAWGPSSSPPPPPPSSHGSGSSVGVEWVPPQFLFSVGRDRAVGVWGVNLPTTTTPATATTSPPLPALAQLALFTPHKRQVLALAVAPFTTGGGVGKGVAEKVEEGEEGEETARKVAAVFATGSRDGVVCIWAIKLLTAEEASSGGGGDGSGGGGGAAAPVELPVPSPPHAPSHSYYCVSLGSLPLVGEVKVGGMASTITTTSSSSGMGGGASAAEPVAITCLDFCPFPSTRGGYLLGVGNESGRVEVWEVGVEEGPAAGAGAGAATAPHQLIKTLPLSHQGSVEALAWRPPTSVVPTAAPPVGDAPATTAVTAAAAAAAEGSMMLVSGGVDGSIMWWSV